jgi:predicted TIM-barrel enzyme
MIATAHKQGLVTTPYVFNAEDAIKMACAGADVVVAHAGLTTSGSIGALSRGSLEDCVGFVQEIRDAAASVNPDILVLCHGGPIAPRMRILCYRGRLGCIGSSGRVAWSGWVAIKENAEEFKRLKVRLE